MQHIYVCYEALCKTMQMQMQKQCKTKNNLPIVQNVQCPKGNPTFECRPLSIRIIVLFDNVRVVSNARKFRIFEFEHI